MSKRKMQSYALFAVGVLAVVFAAQHWGPTRDLMAGRIPTGV